MHKIRRIHLKTFEIEHWLVHEHDKHVQRSWQQMQIFEDLTHLLGIELNAGAVRGWAASPDLLFLIARHARDAQPRMVVECSSGMSTIVLARCMQMNSGGHVYSLEHDPHFAAETRRMLARHQLSSWATVIDAPLVPQSTAAGSAPWYDTAKLPPAVIDMIVIDGPPEPTAPLARYPAGPFLFPKLAPSAAVFLDDYIRSSEQESVRLWLKEFPELLLTEHSFEKGCAQLTASPASTGRAPKVAQAAL